MKHKYDIEASPLRLADSEPRRKFYDLAPVQGLKQKEYTTAWRDLNTPSAESPLSPPHVQDLETIERDRMYGKAAPHKWNCCWPYQRCSCVGRRV